MTPGCPAKSREYSAAKKYPHSAQSPGISPQRPQIESFPFSTTTHSRHGFGNFPERRAGKALFRLKTGYPFFIRSRITSRQTAFSFFRQRQIPGVRIRSMEIEGYGAHRGELFCESRHAPDRALVDPVDRHIKADIPRRGMPHVFQDRVEGVAADGVVPLPVPVQAEKDQIGLGKLQREGAVGDDVDDQKARFLRVDHQVAQGLVPVPPEKGLPAAEKEDPHAEIVKRLHLPPDLPVGGHTGRDIVHRAMQTMEIAAVGDDDGAEDGVIRPEKNGSDPVPRERAEIRKLHIRPPGCRQLSVFSSVYHKRSRNANPGAGKSPCRESSESMRIIRGAFPPFPGGKGRFPVLRGGDPRIRSSPSGRRSRRLF